MEVHCHGGKISGEKESGSFFLRGKPKEKKLRKAEEPRMKSRGRVVQSA